MTVAKKLTIFIFALLTPAFVFAKKSDDGCKIESFCLIDNHHLEIRMENGEKKYLKFDKPIESGKENQVSFVYEQNGKKSQFYITLIGEREDLAEFIINSFTTKGNIRNQDWIEIECIKQGNTDGISIRYNGNLLILGSGAAKIGEKFRFIFEEGLANNRGVIELCATKSAYSRVMDCVVYCKKDKKVDRKDDDEWIGEGVDIEKSTTKKPIIRKRDRNGNAFDTNTKDDFYVFGTEMIRN